jgi:hypothetical protein
MGSEPHVAILMVSCVTDVKISQFWTKKWTEVPSPSFSIAQVLPMKKMKNSMCKNIKFLNNREQKSI